MAKRSGWEMVDMTCDVWTEAKVVGCGDHFLTLPRGLRDQLGGRDYDVAWEFADGRFLVLAYPNSDTYWEETIPAEWWLWTPAE